MPRYLKKIWGGCIRSEGIQQPKTEGEGLRKSHAGKHQPGKNSGIQFSGNEEEMRADDKRKLQGGGTFFLTLTYRERVGIEDAPTAFQKFHLEIGSGCESERDWMH